MDADRNGMCPSNTRFLKSYTFMQDKLSNKLCLSKISFSTHFCIINLNMKLYSDNFKNLQNEQDKNYYGNVHKKWWLYNLKLKGAVFLMCVWQKVGVCIWNMT